MRGPFNHPHRGEDREIRLTRREVRREPPHRGAGWHKPVAPPEPGNRPTGLPPLSQARLRGAGLNPAFEAMLTRQQAPQHSATIEPANLDAASNPLRPSSLDEMVGQAKIRPLLKRLINAAHESGNPLDHLLLVGASGTGKTTVATVVAREMHTRCYVLKCPVDMSTLMALREGARDGDVVFLDELHQQVQGDRRGITESVDVENLFHILEDRVINTTSGPLPFPRVTFIGATTDVGLLPEALVNRFPIQPRLAPYSADEMAELARRNAAALGITLTRGVPEMLAGACRGNPRQLNSYMRSARALGGREVSRETAREVVEDLAGTTLDGYDPSMQAILRHLYLHCRRDTKDGPVYQASANALATAAGHGRDLKIVYSKEAYLIQAGMLSVLPRGRTLTPAGVERAERLVRETSL